MPINFLKKIKIFSDLPQDLLEVVSNLIKTRTYEKGEIIFSEGSPGEAFYFLYSGRVKASKLFPGGQEIIICTLGTGDIFAEVTLLKKDQPYPVTATALAKSEVGFIFNKDLEELLKNNSNMALELIRLQNEKLLEAHYRIRNMGYTDVSARVISILKTMSDNFGKKTEEGIVINFELSRQDLANIAGTTRETVSRIISGLKNQGIIGFQGKRIIIKSIEEMDNFLEKLE